MILMCSKDLPYEYRNKLWDILSKKDRTSFKLEGCQYILNKLNALERPKMLTSEYKFKVELAVDCFLAEIISAMDSLLQEINNRLNLGLSQREVNRKNIIKKLKHIYNYDNKKIADLLQDIYDIKYKNWLWRLKEYRNIAIHRSPLKFINTFTLNKTKGIEFKEIILKPLCGDPDPKEREVLKYLSNSLINMRRLVKAIKNKLTSLNNY